MKVVYFTGIVDRIHKVISDAQADNRTIKYIELEAWEWNELRASNAAMTGIAFLVNPNEIKVSGVPVRPIGADNPSTTRAYQSIKKTLMEESMKHWRKTVNRTDDYSKCLKCKHLGCPLHEFPCSFCSYNILLPSWSVKSDRFEAGE